MIVSNKVDCVRWTGSHLPCPLLPLDDVPLQTLMLQQLVSSMNGSRPWSFIPVRPVSKATWKYGSGPWKL